ncbi:MAG: DUF2252 domain-containing protein [Thermomicrobiales bacterium]|nr:DUF2252 domain-containing protein [Thermomicrobiales bacterium]
MTSLPGFAATSSELEEYGRSLRAALPRRDHAALMLPERDSLAIMEQQHADRLQDLIPVRVGRMLESPFAFYRGSAALMAHDLANAATTGIEVVACGDAHISNFGWYGTPERSLAFDLNDFDEASNAPWEWDVKRLATSGYLAALENNLSADTAKEIARAAATSYRTMLAKLMQQTPLDRYYARVDSTLMESHLRGSARQIVKKSISKARRNTSERVLDKIGVVETDGVLRIVDNPPILVHQPSATVEGAQELVFHFLNTVRADIAVLLSHYTLMDVALRVVGVGSVGTRCYILLLRGPSGEAFFLQIKEAPKTVLETFGNRPPRLLGRVLEQGDGFNGRRIVASQRVLQATSDPFLGYFHVQGRDFYVRQFRDMKGAVDIAQLDANLLSQYVQLCGALLARGHSQSPTAGIIHGYLDGSKRFDNAIADWSAAYAEVVLSDFEVLQNAVKEGRVPAERGL